MIDKIKFPWIAYWVGGLLTFLLIAETFPKNITYTLLAILFIGYFVQDSRKQTERKK